MRTDITKEPHPIEYDLEWPMDGRHGEAAVLTYLHRNGLKARMANYIAPFDLVCNGKRIEVKRASFINNKWAFNIHRHNKLDESKVDVYILRLENVPTFKYAVHLIIAAPIGKKTVVISLRSLLTKYAQHYNRLDLLRS